MTHPSKGERTIRPFTEFLIAQRSGDLLVEIGRELADLVDAVETHRKKGTLTLTLTLVPQGKGNALAVLDDVTTKPPRAERDGSIWFADEDGSLTRTDPRQQTFEDGLRVVEDEPERELRDVETGDAL